MRIHYMSDVHLEFGALDKPLPEGDVVILAGDITLLVAMDPAKTDASAQRVRAATQRFFGAVTSRFAKVVYLMGNHEHYGFCIDEFGRCHPALLPRCDTIGKRAYRPRRHPPVRSDAVDRHGR